jgi:hypothetical protein
MAWRKPWLLIRGKPTSLQAFSSSWLIALPNHSNRVPNRSPSFLRFDALNDFSRTRST